AVAHRIFGRRGGVGGLAPARRTRIGDPSVPLRRARTNSWPRRVHDGLAAAITRRSSGRAGGDRRLPVLWRLWDSAPGPRGNHRVHPRRSLRMRGSEALAPWAAMDRGARTGQRLLDADRSAGGPAAALFQAPAP